MLLAFLVLLPGLARGNVIMRRSIGEGLDVVFEDSPPPSFSEFEGLSSSSVPPQPLGYVKRQGRATKTHSCSRVRGVPSNLRSRSVMFPYGLTNFYSKYTEAYGIPVISSSRVPDDALKRACYTLRFLMADHSGIRQSFFSFSGRVGIMATSEVTTDIPEHSWLDPYFWDARARGLGATEDYPISTGAEENVLCYENDSYRIEDIFLHEFAHGVHLLGAKYAISGWDDRLKSYYASARSSGLWYNTYAMDTYKEYYAEGVQSYFNCNAYANPANGIHNHVDTRAKLKTYDPSLYRLVAEVFPCGNDYINRCEKSRAREAAQRLRMNCNEGDGEDEDGETDDDDDGDDGRPRPPVNCDDLNANCGYWAGQNYCSSSQYADWMSKNCKKSCGKCSNNCKDSNANCSSWRQKGYCSGQYAEYMATNCKKSCNKC